MAGGGDEAGSLDSPVESSAVSSEYSVRGDSGSSDRLAPPTLLAPLAAVPATEIP